MRRAGMSLAALPSGSAIHCGRKSAGQLGRSCRRSSITTHRYSCVSWGAMKGMTKRLLAPVRRRGLRAAFHWIDQVRRKAPNQLDWTGSRPTCRASSATDMLLRYSKPQFVPEGAVSHFGDGMVAASAAGCCSLFPDQWRQRVGGARPSGRQQRWDWIAFGDAERARLDTANDRTRSATAIVSRREAQDAAAAKRSRDADSLACSSVESPLALQGTRPLHRSARPSHDPAGWPARLCPRRR